MAAGSVSGTVLVPAGWLAGEVSWDDAGTITAVTGAACAAPPAGAARLLAGFVDPHVHGGAGADAMAGADAVRHLARFHASQGTVALAPTTMTAPPAQVAAALDGIEAVRRAPAAGEAEVLGAHLEGPFINPARLGAQPPHTMAPDLALAADWGGRARLAVATVAPEMPGGLDLVAQLAAAGTRVQVGHTAADAATAKAALDAGATGFTHLFNAMTGLAGRDPGVVGAALAWGTWAELIVDLQHVAAASCLATVRAVPQAYAITDATAAAGRPDGDHALGGQQVTKAGGTCRTATGALAGTALTMWECRRNLMQIGLAEHLAQEMVAARAARHLGRDDLGEVAVGKAASLVRVVDDRVAEVWVRGRAVPLAG